jgi:hypothetical protein
MRLVEALQDLPPLFLPAWRLDVHPCQELARLDLRIIAALQDRDPPRRD